MYLVGEFAHYHDDTWWECHVTYRVEFQGLTLQYTILHFSATI